MNEKKFEFPENIKNTYGVFLGMSLKELTIYVVPVIAIGLIALFIPPHTVTSIIVKVLIIVLVLTVVIAVVTANPVKYRDNIRLTQYMKMKQQYKKRQKLFFINKKRS